jgi:hypothetical protein
VPGLLARVFQRLPRVDQVFMISMLSTEWAAWAAPQRAALGSFYSGTVVQEALLWLLHQAWPELRPYHRAWAADRAARCGELELLQRAQ